MILLSATFVPAEQHKIFEGSKFCIFHCFPSKVKIYFHENEQMASHVAKLCWQSTKFIIREIKIIFIKSVKFIAHKIFVLYGITHDKMYMDRQTGRHTSCSRQQMAL